MSITWGLPRNTWLKDYFRTGRCHRYRRNWWHDSRSNSLYRQYCCRQVEQNCATWLRQFRCFRIAHQQHWIRPLITTISQQRSLYENARHATVQPSGRSLFCPSPTNFLQFQNMSYSGLALLNQQAALRNHHMQMQTTTVRIDFNS